MTSHALNRQPGQRALDDPAQTRHLFGSHNLLVGAHRECEELFETLGGGPTEWLPVELSTPSSTNLDTPSDLSANGDR